MDKDIGHLSDLDIAAMLEGHLDSPRRRAAEEHLNRCRSCVMLVADVMESSAAEAATGALPPASADLKVHLSSSFQDFLY